MSKWFSRLWMSVTFAFLYIPIIWLLIYSFNESPMVSEWGGLSLKWYKAFIHDSELLSSFYLSIKIAFVCGIVSVVLGTTCAYVSLRLGEFPGRSAFVTLLTIPLIVPEVILGLAVMQLFVSIQDWLGGSQRGWMSIMLGHTQIGIAYATVVIASRLRGLDRTLEEAAQDLGSRPLQVFFYVTLPLIAPALVSSFLLTFTLSFDDVVISSFLAGPGATSMPVVIFSRAKFGMNPVINAAAAVTIFIVTICVILYVLSESRMRSKNFKVRSTWPAANM